RRRVARVPIGWSWQKRARQGTSQLPFEATHGYPYRFKPGGSAPSTPGSSIAGTWSMTFTDEDGPFIGQAELQQEGPKVIGTILTTTGDYRYLEGDFVDGRLRLSTFDGAHAFLFTASVDDQGHLKGDFWSRDTYHATFVAQRKTDERALFDPYREIEVTAEDERMTFRFPDVDGRIVSSEDDRFRGKVVLIDIFGTWCPNCNDLAPLLVEWHKKYSGQGLEIVGLAFEFTDDVDDANDRLRAYVAHHDIPFPVLRAGVSDKDAASTRVPALERVKSYPTTVFIGRDGKISRVHSGFAGPATGDHYVQTVASMEAEIQRLLGAQSAD
ncbi:MAG: TlpA disulfide reductase family protein, partial [Myxococcota bacterium]